MDPTLNKYVSPLSARYASQEMEHFFSASFKIATFRRLWIGLAITQKELGLPITAEQIEEMQSCAQQIDLKQIHSYEKRFRHDIMAHIHAFGDLCPKAKPIIHLGATSSYITDNTDLIQMKEALTLLHEKIVAVIEMLTQLAEQYKDAPTLSYTHYQPAQPTTIGKRMCLWLQDLYQDALDWERLAASLPFLGAKGATGTQASFLALFDADEKKVEELERRLTLQFGFSSTLPISGQTYPRKIDLSLSNALESFAASAHKIATDLRLLAHDGECSELASHTQVGSSAMPHKQNPIYAERICGIARFVISLAQNPAYTAATQWLERSLDDSSNRRLYIPEIFLGVDAILNLLKHELSHLHIDAQKARQHLLREAPFLAIEGLLMHIVKKGGDRQSAHEALRRLALAAKKEEDPPRFLLEKLSEQFPLSKQEIAQSLDIEHMIGRAPEQVTRFIDDFIRPYLLRCRKGRKVSFPDVEL